MSRSPSLPTFFSGNLLEFCWAQYKKYQVYLRSKFCQVLRNVVHVAKFSQHSGVSWPAGRCRRWTACCGPRYMTIFDQNERMQYQNDRMSNGSRESMQRPSASSRGAAAGWAQFVAKRTHIGRVQIVKDSVFSGGVVADSEFRSQVAESIFRLYAVQFKCILVCDHKGNF